MRECIYGEVVVESHNHGGIITEVVKMGDRREEIVRCRDCVHAVIGFADGETSRTTIGCDRFDRPHRRNVVEVEPDGFCTWGAAREKGDGR